MHELLHYQDEDGTDLFAKWLDGLSERRAQAFTAARLVRFENGNFGECAPVGEGVWELKTDWDGKTDRIMIGVNFYSI